MQHQILGWTSFDGLKIFSQVWEPETPPHAVLVLIHGLGEHSSRYAPVAEKFCAAGFALVAFDHRGHGQTAGSRGHFPSYEHVMKDIDQAIQAARQRYPGTPVFIYGHSLGGNLGLYYLWQRRPDIQGAIITSPGLGTANPPSPVTLALGKILYRLAPAFRLNNGLDVQNLSHDPEVIRQYQADPLNHPHISARLGLDLLGSGKDMVARAGEFPRIPMLLFQGGADHIVSPPLTDRLAKALPGPVAYRVWEGGFHELHNDTIKDQVIQSMIDWLNEQIKPLGNEPV